MNLPRNDSLLEPAAGLQAKVQRLLSGVQRTRLDNGMRVLTLEDHSLPVVASMLWYRVGARLEPPGLAGASHFLEHMMFKGSRRFPKGAVDSLTARYGGVNNAFTSHDYTAYYFHFASDRWQVALEIEADRMRAAQFQQREFELERQVILQELGMEEDEPWVCLRQALEKRMLSPHPYARPVIGSRRDLLELDRQRLIDYYRRWYVPSNAIQVVVGDFETAAVLDRIRAWFGPIPGGQPAPPGVGRICGQAPPQSLEFPGRGRVGRLLAGFPAPSIRGPQQLTLQVIDKVLAEGRLGLLYRHLVEQRPVASRVDAEFSETADPSLFLIQLEMPAGQAREEGEERLWEVLSRLTRPGLSESQLHRARMLCLHGFLSSFETPLDQAFGLGLMETLGGYEYWREYVAGILSVSARDVRRYSRRYLNRERAALAWMPPAPEADARHREP